MIAPHAGLCTPPAYHGPAKNIHGPYGSFTRWLHCKLMRWFNKLTYLSQPISFKIYIFENSNPINQRLSSLQTPRATSRSFRHPKPRNLQMRAILLAIWRLMKINKWKWKVKLPQERPKRRSMIGSRKRRRKRMQLTRLYEYSGIVILHPPQRPKLYSFSLALIGFLKPTYVVCARSLYNMFGLL